MRERTQRSIVLAAEEEVGMGEVVSFPTPSGPGQGHLAIAAGRGCCWCRMRAG